MKNGEDSLGRARGSREKACVCGVCPEGEVGVGLPNSRGWMAEGHAGRWGEGGAVFPFT